MRRPSVTDTAPSHPTVSATRTPEEVERIVREFTTLYHDLRDQTLGRTRWFGISVVKPPTDIVVLQEIIAETRPELIVETGVFAGGSALLFASLLEALDIDGKVIGIDVDLRSVPPHIGAHPRIELVEGSSTDPEVVERLRAEAHGRRVMLDLDADHGFEHVTAELDALGPLVTPGCYLVVEDTWLGGRPVRPDLAPGPAEALEAWMARGQPFEADRWRERFLLTSFPGGYLRRLDPTGVEPGGPPRLERFVVPGGSPSSDAPLQAPDQEQQDRYAHEAELETLRAEYGKLHEELRARDRRIAELTAAGGSGGAVPGPEGATRGARARRSARRVPGLRRLADDVGLRRGSERPEAVDADRDGGESDAQR